MKRLILGALALPFVMTDASADHHLVKRALQEARCIPTSLTELTRRAGTDVFEARCKGGPDRVLTLVCTATRCVSDEHANHQSDVDEDGR